MERVCILILTLILILTILTRTDRGELCAGCRRVAAVGAPRGHCRARGCELFSVGGGGPYTTGEGVVAQCGEHYVEIVCERLVIGKVFKSRKR